MALFHGVVYVLNLILLVYILEFIGKNTSRLTSTDASELQKIMLEMISVITIGYMVWLDIQEVCLIISNKKNQNVRMTLEISSIA